MRFLRNSTRVPHKLGGRPVAGSIAGPPQVPLCTHVDISVRSSIAHILWKTRRPASSPSHISVRIPMRRRYYPPSK
ncbi:hypothetical protein PIB30_088329, partial [Stylosanthes scabra]|nr:hypothetical protein [Stylosanthes scabra]